MRPDDGTERGRHLDLRLRPHVAHELAQRLHPFRRGGVDDADLRFGESVDVDSKRLLNSANAFWLPRTRFNGTTSPSRMVRIGFTFSRLPANAAALPMRPPFARYSSVFTVNSKW